MALNPDEEDDFTRLSRELGEVDTSDDTSDTDSLAPARAPAAPAQSAAPKSDDELAKAQGFARHASKRAQLGRAGSDFIAAFGGYKPDNSFWDTEEQQGTRGVADLEKRRASERQSGLDAESKRLHDAQIANYLKPKGTNAGKPAEAVGNLDVVAKFIGVDPKQLEGVTPKTLERITGMRIADLQRQAAEAGRVSGQSFTAGQNTLNRETTLKAAETAERLRQEKEIEADTTHVGKDLEGTAALQKSFASVDSAIADVGKDIPGVGPWDSRKPEWFDSTKDTSVKQGLKQIIATVLKKQSGSTVSSDEYSRTLASYGISPSATPEAFKAGYAALKRAAVAAAKEAEARYKPEAVERYHKRGGVTSGDFEGRAPTPGSAAPQTLAPEDEQAIEWAQANPGNPDAAEILRLHGGHK